MIEKTSARQLLKCLVSGQGAEIVLSFKCLVLSWD